MNQIFLVGLGGAIGAIGRLLVGRLMGRVMGYGFPWGTLTVNVFGGFFIGLLMGWLATRLSPDNENLQLFLAVGILGGFTTFSSFSLEAFRLFETKAYGMAVIYVLGSVILSISAVFMGLLIARRVFAL